MALSGARTQLPSSGGSTRLDFLLNVSDLLWFTFSTFIPLGRICEVKLLNNQPASCKPCLHRSLSPRPHNPCTTSLWVKFFKISSLFLKQQGLVNNSNPRSQPKSGQGHSKDDAGRPAGRPLPWSRGQGGSRGAKERADVEGTWRVCSPRGPSWPSP